jgi:hypothetical protein
MLWRYLSVIDPCNNPMRNVRPIPPYDVSFECSDTKGVINDIKVLAQHGIGMFWSDGCIEYTRFFSEGFRDGTNGMIILFTTSVLHEGTEYRRVKSVFIYAPSDVK